MVFWGHLTVLPRTSHGIYCKGFLRMYAVFFSAVAMLNGYAKKKDNSQQSEVTCSFPTLFLDIQALFPLLPPTQTTFKLSYS
jgi:hypothetical protein